MGKCEDMYVFTPKAPAGLYAQYIAILMIIAFELLLAFSMKKKQNNISIVAQKSSSYYIYIASHKNRKCSPGSMNRLCSVLLANHIVLYSMYAHKHLFS